jgi:UDP-2,3-diacylglucosamine hydrolase
VLKKLALLTDSGIKVHYLAGNHDFWLKGFLENEIGVQVHQDDFISRIGTKKLYSLHGDGLMKSDVGYRLLKRVMRHPLNIFLFRLLHPDFGIPFALFWSHRSRNATSLKARYNDREYREFAERKISEGFDFVILGHTHHAALQKFGNGWYINPGDWMVNFSYAKIKKGVPHLLSWDGSKAQPFKPCLMT